MNAIEGFVSPDVIRTFSAFLEFCYIARRNVINERSLRELEAALTRFHQYRVVFSGTVRAEGLAGFSLPRQHSLVHYHDNIKNFGAPNGLCSSITESKHIVSVKRPWRRSSRYKALSQILKVNERLDKLTAARADFATRGRLVTPPLLSAILDFHNNNNNNSNGLQGGPGGSAGDNNGGGGNGNDNDDNDNDSDSDSDNNARPVESEPLMNEVRLAQEKGKCYFILCFPNLLTNRSTSPHPPIPANICSHRNQDRPAQLS